MLSENLFHVVLVHGEPVVVTSRTFVANENAKVHYPVSTLLLHAVQTEIVEFVLTNFHYKIGNKLCVLLLRKVLGDVLRYLYLDVLLVSRLWLARRCHKFGVRITHFFFLRHD